MTTTEGGADGRNISIDCQDALDDGELLTGTLTVPEVSGLTFASKAVNTSTLTINGRSAVAGEAMQFNVKGTTTGRYTIKAYASTDATPAQTIEATIILVVE